MRLGASLAAASLTAKGALLKYRPFSVGTGGALTVGAAGCAARNAVLTRLPDIT